MTAVRPSSARALWRGPASYARPAVSRVRELERECLGRLAVPADERVLLQELSRSKRRRCKRVKPGDHRALERLLDPLGERRRLGRRQHAVSREPQLGRNREDRCVADVLPKRASRVECTIRIGGEHDEVGLTHGELVRRSLDTELGGQRCGAVGVTRSDDDLEASLVEPPGERSAERPRPPDDRYAHAASRTTSARRLAASRSRMSVSVTTSSTGAEAGTSAVSTTSTSTSPS